MTLTAAIAEIQRVGKLTVEGQVIHCDAPDQRGHRPQRFTKTNTGSL